MRPPRAGCIASRGTCARRARRSLRPLRSAGAAQAVDGEAAVVVAERAAVAAGARKKRRRSSDVAAAAVRWSSRQVHRDARQAGRGRDHAACRVADVRGGAGRSGQPRGSRAARPSSTRSSRNCRRPWPQPQQAATEARTKIEAIRRAVDATPSLPLKVREQALGLEHTLDEINRVVNGDRVIAGFNEGVPASIADHVQAAASPTRGHDRPADEDRAGAVSDRVRPARRRDPEAAEAARDRYQSDREAARRRRALRRPPAACRSGGRLRPASAASPTRGTGRIVSDLLAAADAPTTPGRLPVWEKQCYPRSRRAPHDARPARRSTPRSPRRLRSAPDSGRVPVCGTILLHLLRPDEFERISSGTHKRQIVAAFRAEFLAGEEVGGSRRAATGNPAQAGGASILSLSSERAWSTSTTRRCTRSGTRRPPPTARARATSTYFSTSASSSSTARPAPARPTARGRSPKR